MVNDMCDYWKYYKYTFPIQYSIYFPEYCIIYMMSYLIVLFLFLKNDAVSFHVHTNLSVHSL